MSDFPCATGLWKVDTSGNPVAPIAAAATGESNTLNKMGNKEYLWGQCKTDSDLKRIKLLSFQKVQKGQLLKFSRGIKKAQFYAEFRSVSTVLKKVNSKSYEQKSEEKWSFPTFLTDRQSFWLPVFQGEFYGTFSTDLKIA